MVSSNQGMLDPYSSENLEALEAKLGVCLRNRELLKTAISTRAARNEHPEVIKNDNERLEEIYSIKLEMSLNHIKWLKETDMQYIKD